MRDDRTTVTKEEFEKVVAGLATMDELDYERSRKAIAQGFGIRVSELDALVKKEKRNDGLQFPDEGQGAGVFFVDPAPWGHKVEGVEILGELKGIFERFIVLPDFAATTLALWVMHTHAFDAARISPFLDIHSPQKQCGKSTLLSLMALLVKRPLPASNVSSAVVYRVIEACQPTLLLDEGDSFFREKNELRGILNSGHIKDMAFVIRSVGDDHEPRVFSTWAPKAFAMIGQSPETIADRSIRLTLKRKLADEVVDSLRINGRAEFADTVERCARFAVDNMDDFRRTFPETPVGMINRVRDNWEPLLAIADVAGGQWPDDARAAAIGLTVMDDDESIKIMLLQDIRTVFAESGHDQMFSETLVKKLEEFEHRPWPEFWRGKPLSKSGLARLLKGFKIRPRTIRNGAVTSKGYHRAAFEDAFARYIPLSPLSSPDLPVTPSQSFSTNGSGRHK